MRSARRNIGEHSANPSSLSAAGRPDEAVSHSRWRHIGTYIVSFSNVLGPVSDGLVCPFFVGRVLVEGPLLAACCRMGIPLPVVHRENLGVTGVGRLLTRCRRSRVSASGKPISGFCL